MSILTESIDMIGSIRYVYSNLIEESNDISIIEEDIDMDEGHGCKLRPVFIVLLYSDSNFDHVAEKFVKNQTYWHASIGFGPGLTKLYSFNYGEFNANKFKGGLSFESISKYAEAHPTGTMELSCIFLSTDKFKALKETLDYYIENKEKTRYSFINLIKSLFGVKEKNGLKFNLVCSTFVDTILRSIDVNISKDVNTNLTKPDYLKADPSKEKQFKVYEGKIVDFDAKKIASKVEKLANKLGSDYFAK